MKTARTEAASWGGEAAHPAGLGPDSAQTAPPGWCRPAPPGAAAVGCRAFAPCPCPSLGCVPPAPLPGPPGVRSLSGSLQHLVIVQRGPALWPPPPCRTGFSRSNRARSNPSATAPPGLSSPPSSWSLAGPRPRALWPPHLCPAFPAARGAPPFSVCHTCTFFVSKFTFYGSCPLPFVPYAFPHRYILMALMIFPS